MKKVIVAGVALLLIAAAAIWYLKFAGVTHEDIYDAVTGESDKVQSVVDDRYRKLDKLLEIANRPLPDGMQRAE